MFSMSVPAPPKAARHLKEELGLLGTLPGAAMGGSLHTGVSCTMPGAYPARRRAAGSSRPPSWPEEEGACSSSTLRTTSSSDLQPTLTSEPRPGTGRAPEQRTVTGRGDATLGDGPWLRSDPTPHSSGAPCPSCERTARWRLPSAGNPVPLEASPGVRINAISNSASSLNFLDSHLLGERVTFSVSVQLAHPVTAGG